MSVLRAMVLLLVAAPPLSAQPPVSFFYQNVPLWSDDGAFTEGGFSNFNRLRVMSEPGFGDFHFQAAYEQVATFRENDSSGGFLGRVPGGGEWLKLQWTLADEEHVLWQHRFDRLLVSWTPSSSFELSAGRQTVSWATTLFLTPSDPFSPFSPADPFRIFRAGVDALRVRMYPGPLSELDVVVRPTRNDEVGDELTVLGRGLTTWRNWEVSGWAGSLYGDVSGAFGAAGSLGSWAIRGEGVVRETEGEGGAAFRGTIGVDRRAELADRELYVIVEYQHDGLAAADADGYVEVLGSSPFLRGELQVLGRHEVAVQGSYQVTPLLSVAALGLWNVGDQSLLLSPSLAYSASDETSLSAGLFFGFGDDEATESRPVPSEYGAVPITAFFSFSWLF